MKHYLMMKAGHTITPEEKGQDDADAVRTYTIDIFTVTQLGEVKVKHGEAVEVHGDKVLRDCMIMDFNARQIKKHAEALKNENH